ncbi:MAG: M23 family metallopeptidase [Xenococcus sp. MO_188.B8]|nr:M23 family metallopeptidase [Xenococcus sp. MO_188.B8]
MKNLLSIVLVFSGTLFSFNKVLAAGKIPEVDFMTRILSKNLTSNRLSSRSASSTRAVPVSLIPNSSVSYQENLSQPQTVGQRKFEFYLLKLINSFLIPELTIATQDVSVPKTKRQKLPLQSEKSFTKNQKISYFPKVNRSSVMVNPPNAPAFSQKLSLVNPVPETKKITSSFGWRIRPYSGQVQFHKGIDYGAPLGSPVVAAGNGIVTKVVSGCVDFRNLSCGQQFGNRIEIDHGNGVIATYAHLLNNSIKIKEGTKVWKNQEIAQVGSSGWSSGAHLDFRIEVNGEFQDPIKFIKE